MIKSENPQLFAIKKMKIFFLTFYISFLIYPAEAVTTKMFRVLDTCARYRLGEINADEAIVKLKLKLPNSFNMQPKVVVSKYCSVFTPNEKIEF